MTAKPDWFDAVFGPMALELRGMASPRLRAAVRDNAAFVEDLKSRVSIKASVNGTDVWPRHKPSREFMIQQATLNALAEHMPAATRLDGAPSAMRHLVALCGWEHGQPSRWFCRSVRDHFAVIEAQYHD